MNEKRRKDGDRKRERERDAMDCRMKGEARRNIRSARAPMEWRMETTRERRITYSYISVYIRTHVNRSAQYLQGKVLRNFMKSSSV